jgi:DNA-binding protein, stimulates sugar fermentation
MELIRLPEPVECEVVARRNRFVVEVAVQGRVERAYTNNTGRLSEFMVPGRKCYCLHKEGGATSLRLIAFEDSGGAALIDTAIQAKAFEVALQRGCCRGLPAGSPPGTPGSTALFSTTCSTAAASLSTRS